MKTKRITSIFFVFGLLFFIGTGCQNDTNSVSKSESYAERINKQRKKLNKDLKNDLNSPILSSKKERFVGLNYFDPNEDWVIPASVTSMDTLATVKMATSTGELRDMIPYVLLTFVKDGTTHELIGFLENNAVPQELFVPFYDDTNGKETYAGGRYLKVTVNNTDSVNIDFNSVYNPYCHYNEQFSCPIPPIKNSLQLAVTAGEKLLYTY